mgnify:CR=1 FL=1
MNKFTYISLNELAKKYGNSFYLYYPESVKNNYRKIINAFSSFYDRVIIAYAYKTNYLPHLCKTINELGGMSEISSDIEYEISRNVGVCGDKIIFNGPCITEQLALNILKRGGLINIDSIEELKMIGSIAENHRITARIGIRCFIQTSKKRASKFGITPYSSDMDEMLAYISAGPYFKLEAIHCHVKGRSLKDWEIRISEMIKIERHIFSKYHIFIKYINLGGGIPSIPDMSMKEYAEIVGNKLKKEYVNSPDRPFLILEPGTGISADSMDFVSKVLNIKTCREQNIAFLDGSYWQINPMKRNYTIPMQVISNGGGQYYQEIDFSGITCLEDDYFYTGYSGNVQSGDFVLFHSVGAYSIVLKPPFITENVSVIKWPEQQVVKRKEYISDILTTFYF